MCIKVKDIPIDIYKWRNFMHKVNLGSTQRKVLKTIVSAKAPSNESILENASASLKEYNISLPNRKYLKKASDLIEDMWTKIRKGELISESPLIPISPRRRPLGILRPIYNNNKELLLEIADGRRVERIFLDREKFKYFRYEKSVPTDHGSATLKYVDSRVSQDETVAENVNEIVDTYLKSLFPASPRHKYWDKYFTKDEL